MSLSYKMFKEGLINKRKAMKKDKIEYTIYGMLYTLPGECSFAVVAAKSDEEGKSMLEEAIAKERGYKNMNVLLTTVGRRSYMVKYFKDALSGVGEVHAGNSIYSTALLFADKHVLTPMIYAPDYINYLLEYCKKNAISVIIPLFDLDLTVLASSKDIFEKENIKIVVSESSVISICNDKWETYKFLKHNGFETPKTYLSVGGVIKDLQANLIQFPIIIKPRWGMGSIGLHLADDESELTILYKKALNDIKKSYLQFESNQALNECIIVQEYLNGIEYGLDIINDLEENYITTFVKRKIEMRSGETFAAITEFNEELERIGQSISKYLKHTAILDVDCNISKGKVYILELNARFGGHYPFSHLAGANIPKAIISWLNNEEPDVDLFTINYGVQGAKDIVPVLCKTGKD